METPIAPNTESVGRGKRARDAPRRPPRAPEKPIMRPPVLVRSQKVPKTQLQPKPQTRLTLKPSMRPSSVKYPERPTIRPQARPMARPVWISPRLFLLISTTRDQSFLSILPPAKECAIVYLYYITYKYKKSTLQR